MTILREIYTALKLRVGEKIGAAVLDLSDAQPQEPCAAEAACLPTSASAKRKQHFAAGREAAHRALHQIGASSEPILRGTSGEPLWPEATLGSISHSGNWVVALAARQADFAGLGVDLEHYIRAGAPDIASRVCTAPELAWINEDGNLRSARLTALFSAKESIYKCLYPRVRSYIGFKQAQLIWQPDSSCFLAQVNVPKIGSFQLSCNVISFDELLITSTVLGNSAQC